MKLVVGLGNPGAQYEGTRHNIGFELLERWARRRGVTFQLEKKWEAQVAQSEGLFLVKPQTFMNLSGRSVASLARFYRWQPEQILVVYDEVALPVGRLRFRAQGGAGGHNGVKSLISHLGSEAFNRLRVGVGAARGGELVGHVLGRFAPEEKLPLEKTLEAAQEALELVVTEGVEVAANAFNAFDARPPQAAEAQEE